MRPILCDLRGEFSDRLEFCARNNQILVKFLSDRLSPIFSQFFKSSKDVKSDIKSGNLIFKSVNTRKKSLSHVCVAI